ncbi:unnamed protein product [Caenorhabditis nigoni]
MPEKGIPLLKLPSVVQLECIGNLDLLEILVLSLLSKRAKRVAKLNRWTPLTIRLQPGHKNQIHLTCPTNPWRIWIINSQKDNGSSKHPYLHSITEGLYIFDYLTLKNNGNYIEYYKQMAEHVCEVFRSPICAIIIGEGSLIDWIIKYQPTIREVWIHDDVITSVETLDRIFKNLKVTDYFQLGSLAIDEKFRYTEPIPFPSLTISTSSWFTLPALLNGNNSIIHLFGSKWAANDINTILREWQRGSKLRNLESFEIQAPILRNRESHFNEVLEGLNWTESFGNYRRHRTMRIDEDRIHLIRSDGMIGSISANYVVNKNKEIIIFKFQVWRRQT